MIVFYGNADNWANDVKVIIFIHKNTFDIFKAPRKYMTNFTFPKIRVKKIYAHGGLLPLLESINLFG